jgi:hypothetical protein
VAEKAKLDAIKRHIGVLVRRKDYVVPHDPRYPTRWWFGGVTDPRSGKPFTPFGAWDFIAEKLDETGTRIKEIAMDKPPGTKGYVLREPTKWGIIYIKVQFGGEGRVIFGRSFHYD